MDDGERDRIGGGRLRVCEWIVKFYARFAVLPRAGFTNSRRRAERIGVYTLITTCLLARELEYPAQLGLLVDTMSDIIGRCVAARARRPKLTSCSALRCTWGEVRIS